MSLGAVSMFLGAVFHLGTHFFIPSLSLLHAEARNCQELLGKGKILSGWYTIYPQGCNATTVFCDMDTDGGGWIVSGMKRGRFLCSYK